MASLNSFRFSAYKRWAFGLFLVFCLQLAGCDLDKPDSTSDTPNVEEQTPELPEISEDSTNANDASTNSPTEEEVNPGTPEINTAGNENALASESSQDPANRVNDETAGSSAIVIDHYTPDRLFEAAEDELICVDEDSYKTPDEIFRLSTLVNLYHGGNKTAEESQEILCTRADNLRNARERYLTLPQSDWRNLFKWYPEDPIRYIVTRDTDGDGILDVRVKEYGAFLPNDLDADNDGILNLKDARPLVPDRDAAKDSDGDGLPDHLDWSHEEVVSAEDADEEVKRFDFSGDRSVLIEKQLLAFNKFDVVLVEQDYPFSLPLVEMVLEVLEIFEPMMDEYGVKEALQSITMASKYGVYDHDVLAEVSPVNGQMILYGDTVNRFTNQNPSSIYTFAVFVHEFTHVIQNAMDYASNKQFLQETNVHERPVNFISEVKKLGWTIEIDDKKNLPLHGYLKHGEESFRPKERYKNRLGNEFKDICDIWKTVDGKRIYNEQNWNTVEGGEIWNAQNFVSCYSTHDVREWHAEYVTATVLHKMYDFIENSLCVGNRYFGCNGETIKDDTQSHWKDDGDRYWLDNMEEKEMKSYIDQIAAQLQISDELLCKLSIKYAVKPSMGPAFNPDFSCGDFAGGE